MLSQVPAPPPTSCRGASQPSPPLSPRLSQSVSPHWRGAAVVSVQWAYRDHRHRNNRGAEQQKKGMGTAPGVPASEGAVLPPGHCFRGCGAAAGKAFWSSEALLLGQKAHLVAVRTAGYVLIIVLREEVVVAFWAEMEAVLGHDRCLWIFNFAYLRVNPKSYDEDEQ